MKYGVIRKSDGAKLGTYQAAAPDYSDPFGPQNDVVHFVIGAGEYLEGYSLNVSYVPIYDVNYIPYAGSYTFIKKNEFDKSHADFHAFITNFSVENSEILNVEIARKYALYLADNADADGLNAGDPVAMATFVRSKLDPLVDAMLPLFHDVHMNYFWRIEELVALIPREPLLASEARITAAQAELISIVRP